VAADIRRYFMLRCVDAGRMPHPRAIRAGVPLPMLLFIGAETPGPRSGIDAWPRRRNNRLAVDIAVQ
jgi:hypothetical protein